MYGISHCPPALTFVLLMGELFGDTLRKKDASWHSERPFSVMCHQKANPFTDLRGVPSRTRLKRYIFIEVTPRGDTLSLNPDLKFARIRRARQMSSIVPLDEGLLFLQQYPFTIDLVIDRQSNRIFICFFN